MTNNKTHRCCGLAAINAKTSLTPWQYDIPKATHKTLVIEIDYCGVCHSDLDIIDNTWQDTQYPIIPGHEIIGTIIEIGDDVTKFSVGDRVGVSWQQGHCGQCQYCLADQPEYCHKLSAIGLDHQGGFANKISVHQDYACIIPDNLDSSTAAPLLCAGATVFHAISHNHIKANDRVAVLGIGGLGHLAIQFLAKLGANVIAIDPEHNKADDCLRFGATQFIHCNDTNALNKYQDQLDFILVTTDTAIDLALYLPLLKATGTLCFAGMPEKEMTLPLFSMIIGAKTITAVNIGNTANIERTLAFCARHQIGAEVELLPLEDANLAIQKLRQHSPRYRIVLQHKKTN